MATTYTVSSAAELQSALSQATGGDTVLLEAGSYGSLDLSNMQFTSYVTLRSADPENEAVVTSVRLEDSSFIRIDDLHVSHLSNGVNGGKIVNILNSDHIEIINSEVNALVDDIYEGSNGIYVKDSSDVQLLNNDVHDVHNGILVFGGQNFTINENLIDYVASDFFKFGGVTNVLIENNTGGGHLFPSETAHADFMQFQGWASDVIIRGNVFLAQTTERAQGIFLNVPPYSNILIEQNIIYSGKVNAIKVADGSGITIRDNTVLTTPDAGHNVAAIIAPAGSVVENNISSGNYGTLSGSNIIAQWDDVTDIYHYDTLFVNAMVGLGGITLEDLRPVDGSLAETNGAYDRLMELLDGVSNPDPTPVPDPDPTPVPDPEPTPDPDPTPVPDPDPTDDGDRTQAPPIEDVVFTLEELEVMGKSDVENIAHAPDLALPSATIALTFNADTVSGSHGILSKDAKYYDGGGNHFTSYIKNGTLFVRFQDGDGDKVFTVTGINANMDYDLQVAFGGGNVTVWLDGETVGTAAFDMSWENNVEYMQIGANGWSSSSGSSSFRNVFDGTISDVAIVAGVYSPAEMAMLGGDGSPPDPDVPPDVPPVPDGEAQVIFSLMGDTEFLGTKSGIINTAHNQSMETSEGSIAFSFDADNVTTQAGLISKDASGYTGGGNHLSIWIEDGTLRVRFQDEDSDAFFTVDDINANQEYDVLATFDANNVALYLDGTLIGSQSFTMDLNANQQYLQVGGLGWASESGGSAATSAFDGTISNVMILDEAMVPQDFAFFA